MAAAKKVVIKPTQSMELDTNKALLIVRITNNLRLTADVTEDFFLVDCSNYLKAVSVMEDQDNITRLADVMYALNGNKIPYEHIMNGQRFFFGDGGVSEDYV
jgi:hypothetical protein